jgi:uncharacterized protein YpmB
VPRATCHGISIIIIILIIIIIIFFFFTFFVSSSQSLHRFMSSSLHLSIPSSSLS